METAIILMRVKKNSQLSRAEKKELSEFWQTYKCPMDGDSKLEAYYFDGEVKQYSVKERLDFFYDETPDFIERFFAAMSRGEEFRTRFAMYKPLSVA